MRTRVYLALHAAGAAGLRRVDLAQQLADLTGKQLEQNLYQLKKEGWVLHAGKGEAYTLAPGMAAPPIDGLARQRGDTEGGTDEAPLAVRAFRLLARAAGGLDSAQIARQLGVSAQAADAALRLDVDCHRLVTCAVLRDGERLTLYRLGSGRVRPAAADAALPPAAAADLKLELSLADAQAEPADEPAGAVQPGPAAAPERFDDGQQFLVALYSDGVLWMQLEDGQQVDLQPQETRALFQYLDRLGGTALAEALPCR
jgi:hypothetical protein